MKVSSCALAIAITSSAIAAPCHATDPIVWDNGDIYFTRDQGFWMLVTYGTVNGDGIDATVIDDFVLEQDTHVTGMQWAGVPDSDLPDGFIIEFYASDPANHDLPPGGTLDPSELALASYFIDIEDVVATDEPSWPGDEDFFHFAADLPTPFEANAGEHYWLSFQGFYKGSDEFNCIQSNQNPLQTVAVSYEGDWYTWPFPREAYDGGLTFKLHGVPACPGDVVTSATFQPPGDGQVDGADLAFLLGAWGANPGSFADLVTSETFQPPPDGVVDGADLAVLLGAWGACD